MSVVSRWAGHGGELWAWIVPDRLLEIAEPLIRRRRYGRATAEHKTHLIRPFRRHSLRLVSSCLAGASALLRSPGG